ncbi:MAG: hypothetical protein IPM79_27145 [Polyangiaceae bacterium]|nr:hypothetical protein [Polyangiaceae bacterium]
MIAAARTATGRNAYAELLRDTRGMKREQQQARDAWFAALSVDRKDEILFELEVLLKGLACFANPRNHPGSAARRTFVSLDFRDHLQQARDGVLRIVQLSRSLLGERDRAFVFHRYLETVLPEDGARSRLLRSSLSDQETPEESLIVMRHGLTNLVEVMNGLLKLQRVPFRLFYSMAATAMRESAQSTFFNPLAALEFRPEFDRIPSPQVLELIQRVTGEQAHRLVALSFLSLFRMLKYLRLLESISHDLADRRVGGRAYLVLSVLRSDARALSGYLRRKSGALLAEGFEHDLLKVPAREIAERFEELRGEGSRLIAMKGALTGVASNLRLEMRRTFEHDLPTVESNANEADLRARLREVTKNLRPSIQNAILFLGKSLRHTLDDGQVFDDLAARRASSERLRRDIWMFAQIVRAFASKARHADLTVDQWSKVQSFAFVREFLGYFRAMGYPLLRVGDYPRFDAFMGAMSGLTETDMFDPQRLAMAIEEADAFHAFLVELLSRISERVELREVPFDKAAAARALRLYLGD